MSKVFSCMFFSTPVLYMHVCTLIMLDWLIGLFIMKWWMSSVKHVIHVSPFGTNLYMYTNFVQVPHTVQGTYSSSTREFKCTLRGTKLTQYRYNGVKWRPKGTRLRAQASAVVSLAAWELQCDLLMQNDVKCKFWEAILQSCHVWVFFGRSLLSH